MGFFLFYDICSEDDGCCPKSKSITLRFYTVVVRFFIEVI